MFQNANLNGMVYKNNNSFFYVAETKFHQVVVKSKLLDVLPIQKKKQTTNDFFFFS